MLDSDVNVLVNLGKVNDVRVTEDRLGFSLCLFFLFLLLFWLGFFSLNLNIA
jgi:hypothetical protein